MSPSTGPSPLLVYPHNLGSQPPNSWGSFRYYNRRVHMKNAKYDIYRLRADLRQLATEIRLLKKQIRTPNYLPSWKEYRDLRAMKEAFTILCCLRAHHRGRLHLKDAQKSVERAQAIEDKYML